MDGLPRWLNLETKFFLQTVYIQNRVRHGIGTGRHGTARDGVQSFHHRFTTRCTYSTRIRIHKLSFYNSPFLVWKPRSFFISFPFSVAVVICWLWVIIPRWPPSSTLLQQRHKDLDALCSFCLGSFSCFGTSRLLSIAVLTVRSRRVTLYGVRVGKGRVSERVTGSEPLPHHLVSLSFSHKYSFSRWPCRITIPAQCNQFSNHNVAQRQKKTQFGTVRHCQQVPWMAPYLTMIGNDLGSMDQPCRLSVAL